MSIQNTNSRAAKITFVLALFLLGLLGHAENLPIKAKIHTDTEARILNLRIPAPRGAIVDRNGQMLAVSSVKKNLMFRFSKYKNTELAWEDFKTQLQLLGPDTAKGWGHTLESRFSFTKSQVLNHFKNRHWIPFELVSVLSDEEVKALEQRFSEIEKHSFVMEGVYSRLYPEGQIAGHVLGRIGAVPGVKPDSEIATYIQGREKFLDPMFVEWIGHEGVEAKFEDRLKGQDGLMEMYIDSDGSEAYRKLRKAPVQGHNIVTTLNLEWQKVARKALEKKAKRGSFLLMDNRTGELLVAVSTPSVDPNLYVPSISQEGFDKLRNDPDNPLLARAWQGQYPPGSTFKPITTLTAFEKGVFQIPWGTGETERSLGAYAEQWTVRDCPMDVQVGNNVFPNWFRKYPEGQLNLYNALARSCNTYFVPLGVEVGSTALVSMAKRFGFASLTGLDVSGEAPGALPQRIIKDENGKEEKVYFGDAHAANLSIGQGEFLVTPVQLLRAFSAIATGGKAPVPKLVKQIQDQNLNVLEEFVASGEDKYLDPQINPEQMKVIERGLYHVVHSERGTGMYAKSDRVIVAGKTGTAQWKHRDQYAVWFAGFVSVPNEVGGYDTPYSFVVSVEGDRGQGMGGATFCAPAVGELIEYIYKDVELPFQARLSDLSLPGETLQTPRYNQGDYYQEYPQPEQFTPEAYPSGERPQQRRRQPAPFEFFRGLFGR